MAQELRVLANENKTKRRKLFLNGISLASRVALSHKTDRHATVERMHSQAEGTLFSESGGTKP